MFSFHWANGPESSTTLCLEVRQMAVSANILNNDTVGISWTSDTTVFSRFHQNEAVAALAQSLLSMTDLLGLVYVTFGLTSHQNVISRSSVDETKSKRLFM